MSKTEFFVEGNPSPIEQEENRPFPYWPARINKRELIRNELLLQLNMWDNNDPAIAKRHALSLIDLLRDQFEIGRV